MKKTIVLLVLILLLIGCNQNWMERKKTCRYSQDEYGNSLIWKVADANYHCIEELGMLIEVVGAANAIAEGIDPKVIIKVYKDVQVLLTLGLTGIQFVEGLDKINEDYEALISAGSVYFLYRSGFMVPDLLDDQTIAIINKFCTKRINYYERKAQS